MIVGDALLVIGTGAVPVWPPIAGLDQLGPADGVHVLHTMADTFALTEALDREPRSAVIVGAGYIDADLARLVADELDQRGVIVHTGTAVTAIESTGWRSSARRPTTPPSDLR